MLGDCRGGEIELFSDFPGNTGLLLGQNTEHLHPCWMTDRFGISSEFLVGRRPGFRPEIGT